MLDDVTKRRINTLRQILVGKLPDPKAQVEQITNGLIYKFMNDMDEQSVSMGGKSTYFSGKFQKYSWKNLFNTKTSGVEKLSLYSEALNLMSNNENLPELFRDIFKDSFLPFKDSSTLNMFLKEINEFHYSNSEKLGDAFEYLLSFMGSQGDAGQFRTPRHIIDFIVEIVNPQKKETILDPACGTAGFLISSYKHILKQNTKKNLGDNLNASDRKKIGENLNGYDISPDMVKMSLVNMYLHKFTSPNISEYDTLSSEDKWNDYYDVILANPPFFSPKGGITPHNRFGVKSTKAEVLFVDYMNEHLKPNGRAGIIVPEGIIFQAGTAYKQLRKKLIETSLIGVISLPAGVFQPYSGVKTSILILDKKEIDKRDNIFFGKINNDGYSLNTNRLKISENDMPKLKKLITKKEEKFNFLQFIKRNDLLKNLNFSLSINNYIVQKEIKSKFEIKKISEIFNTSSGGTPLKSNKSYYENGTIPWLNSGDIKSKIIKSVDRKITNLGLENSSAKIFPKNTVLIAMYGATVGNVGILGLDACTNQAVCGLYPNNITNPEYVYYVLNHQKNKIKSLAIGGAQPNISQTIIKDLEIPFPPIETQNQIVEELDGYQKIIDGCRQVIENYKPSIDIDPSWEMVEMNKLCEKITDGSHNPPKEEKDGGHYMLSSKNIFYNKLNFKKPREISKEDFDRENKRTNVSVGDVLLTIVGTIGRSLVVEDLSNKFTLQRSVAVLKIKKEKINPYFLNYIIQSNTYQKLLNDKAQGVAQKGIYLKTIGSIKIPIPSIDKQNSIVNNIKQELDLIKNNELIIKNFNEKLKKTIDRIWFN